jgi:hypothetical protein
VNVQYITSSYYSILGSITTVHILPQLHLLYTRVKLMTLTASSVMPYCKQHCFLLGTFKLVCRAKKSYCTTATVATASAAASIVVYKTFAVQHKAVPMFMLLIETTTVAA